MCFLYDEAKHSPKHMGIVLVVANQKGGVGKTITTTCIASILNDQGYKVLTISLDPQRNFDMVAGKGIVIRRGDTESLSMLHVLKRTCTLEEAIVHSNIGDLARASSQLYQWTGEQVISEAEYRTVRDDLPALQKLLDERILNGGSGMKVLNSLLEPVKNKYDIIVVDTNPSLTLLTLNSLYAADYVLIPAFSEKTSIEAIVELWDTIQSIKYFNPGKYLEIIGILMTKCDVRTTAVHRYERGFANIAQKMGTRLFKTKIRQSARGKDYIDSGVDLIHYDPKGKTTEDYRAFVEELKIAIKEMEEKR